MTGKQVLNYRKDSTQSLSHKNISGLRKTHKKNELGITEQIDCIYQENKRTKSEIKRKYLNQEKSKKGGWELNRVINNKDVK